MDTKWGYGGKGKEKLHSHPNTSSSPYHHPDFSPCLPASLALRYRNTQTGSHAGFLLLFLPLLTFSCILPPSLPRPIFDPPPPPSESCSRASSRTLNFFKRTKTKELSKSWKSKIDMFLLLLVAPTVVLGYGTGPPPDCDLQSPVGHGATESA